MGVDRLPGLPHIQAYRLPAGQYRPTDRSASAVAPPFAVGSRSRAQPRACRATRPAAWGLDTRAAGSREFPWADASNPTSPQDPVVGRDDVEACARLLRSAVWSRPFGGAARRWAASRARRQCRQGRESTRLPSKPAGTTLYRACLTYRRCRLSGHERRPQPFWKRRTPVAWHGRTRRACRRSSCRRPTGVGSRTRSRIEGVMPSGRMPGGDGLRSPRHSVGRDGCIPGEQARNQRLRTHRAGSRHTTRCGSSTTPKPVRTCREGLQKKSARAGVCLPSRRPPSTGRVPCDPARRANSAVSSWVVSFRARDSQGTYRSGAGAPVVPNAQGCPQPLRESRAARDLPRCRRPAAG